MKARSELQALEEENHALRKKLARLEVLASAGKKGAGRVMRKFK